jgi:hypothetical protein
MASAATLKVENAQAELVNLRYDRARRRWSVWHLLALRQVEALEKSLGGKALFTRSQSGLLPTRTALGKSILWPAEI